MSDLAANDRPRPPEVSPYTPVSHAAIIAAGLLVFAFATACLVTEITRMFEAIHNFNYFHSHIPGILIHYLYLAVVFGPFPCALVAALIARRQIRRSNNAICGLFLVNSILLLSPLWLVLLVSIAGGGSSGPRHHPVLSDHSNVIDITLMCQGVAREDALHAYPQHLAVLVALQPDIAHDIRLIRNRSAAYAGPFPKSPADWRSIAAEVDAHSDFIYLAGDLVDSPALAKVADKVILFYQKPDPDDQGHAQYNSNTGQYEYIAPTRIVAFANNDPRNIPAPDLPALFAAHNAARAALGLPPQALDVQPPIPTTAPTRPAAP